MRTVGVLVFLAAAAAAGEEWADLFDGRTLRGWTTTGGPYDGKALWSVEDGAIVGREGPGRAGGLLYTVETYRNVEVELEVRLSYPFDSGVFLRMRPDARGAQVTLDHRPGGEIGGIYADGWWRHNPDGARRFKRDEWNRVRVRCAGDPMHMRVWVNGHPVTDFRLPEGAAFAREGRIGLQVHGARADAGEARFRGIRARRLPDDAGRYFDDAGALTPAGVAAGWRALTLEGADGYALKDGVLALLVRGKTPHLVSKEDYRDFHLRLDFKIARMANSGVFLRAARGAANPAYSGCEIQILDDFNWEQVTDSTLKPWQFTGSLYGAVAPNRRALRPLGEWNTFEVTCRGPRILTALNGAVLYDVDTHRLLVHPLFAARAQEGFIGIQRHAPSVVEGDAYAWFRRMYVRRLAAGRG